MSPCPVLFWAQRLKGQRGFFALIPAGYLQFLLTPTIKSLKTTVCCALRCYLWHNGSFLKVQGKEVLFMSGLLFFLPLGLLLLRFSQTYWCFCNFMGKGGKLLCVSIHMKISCV